MTEGLKWRREVKEEKRYFLENILSLLEEDVLLENSSVPVRYKDTNINGMEAYSGNISLFPVLYGGYILEYIYDVDLENEAIYPTEDVDIVVKIPDIFFSEDYDVIDSDEHTFFDDISSIVYSRILNSNIPSHESYVNATMESKEKVDQYSISSRIALLICKNGVCGKIADIILTFEFFSNSFRYSSIVKNGLLINYPNILSFCFMQFSGLAGRFLESGIEEIKLHNHIARIFYCLKIISSDSEYFSFENRRKICTFLDCFISKISNKRTIEDIIEYQIGNFSFKQILKPWAIFFDDSIKNSSGFYRLKAFIEKI